MKKVFPINEPSLKHAAFVALFFLLQMIAVLHLSNHREYLFCDEVHSYGLANCLDYAFIIPYDYQNEWIDSDVITSYTLYNGDSDYFWEPCLKNQADDVHPPLYYCFIHLFCKLFQKNNVDVFPGILFNLLLLLPADVAVLYLSFHLFPNRLQQLLPLLIWGFSSACFSNVVFIRMYMLQTLEFLLFLCWHVYVEKQDGSITISQMFALSVIVTAAGLTHYYFYIFAFLFGALFCITRFLKRNWIDPAKYILSFVFGACMAVFLFPESLINHILSPRTTETTGAIGQLNLEKLAEALSLFFAAVAGHGIVILVLVIGLVCSFIYIRRVKKVPFTPEKRVSLPGFILRLAVVCALFFYFAMNGAVNGDCTRYLYPIMPLFALILAACIFWAVSILPSRPEQILSVFLCVLLPVLSLALHGVEWMYSDFDSRPLQTVNGSDAIVFYDPSTWNDVNRTLIVMNHFDEIMFVSEDDYDGLLNTIIQRKTPEDPVVLFFIGYANNDERIMADYPLKTYYSSASLVASYEWRIYKLNP